MNYSDINDRLKDLRTEDFIWIIYIGIIIMSWYANSLERRYFLQNDIISREKYRKVIITIFIILIIVYIYFLKDSIEALKKLRPSDSNKKKKLTYLSFLASLFIAISGFIYLYILIVDETIDVEIAFN